MMETVWQTVFEFFLNILNKPIFVLLKKEKKKKYSRNFKMDLW